MIFNFITWNVSPAIDVAGLEVRWYGLLFALGFFFAYAGLYYIFKKEKVSFKLLDWLTLYFFIATLVGARLGHCFFYEWDYYKNNIAEIFMIWKGGLASHGAAIAIVLALIIYVKKHKVDIWWLFDRVALVIPIVAAFVRFGNLMNSEIYGHPTQLPWGFIFIMDEKAGLIPRHPSQLYEAFTYLFISLLLFSLYFYLKGKVRKGLFVGLFLIIMFVSRFFIEFLKEVQVDFEKNMALSMGQWLSIPFILLGLFFLVISYRSAEIPQPPKKQN